MTESRKKDRGREFATDGSAAVSAEDRRAVCGDIVTAMPGESKAGVPCGPTDDEEGRRRAARRRAARRRAARRRIARRRAAAAEQQRLASGNSKSFEGIRDRLRKKAGDGRRAAGVASSDRRGTALSRVLKIVMIAVCICGILCFSPLNEIFRAESDRVEASAFETDTRYEVIKIRKGDSLWSLATAYYKPEYHSIPAFIEEIRECNQLKDDRIYAGCYLMIPR